MSALRGFWNDVVNTAKETVDDVKEYVSKTFGDVLGSETELDAPDGTPPTLRLGDKDGDGWVAYLQKLLNDRLDGALETDGVFGKGTEKALRAFQKQAKLEADGIAGNQTWAALRAGWPEVPSDPQTPALKSIVITPPYLPPMVEGGTQPFAATGVYADGRIEDLTRTVSWSSSDATVVRIDPYGLAAAGRAGEADLKAECSAVRASIHVIVGPANPNKPKTDPSTQSALAGQIRAAIAGGGINVAIYMIGNPDDGDDREFKWQAVVWARNHGAFGLSGAKVKKDHAMPLSADPGKLVTDLLEAMKKELGTHESIPIANLALFSHGEPWGMQIDSKGVGGGERWASSTGKVVKDLAAAVRPALSTGAKIHLFACSAAKDRDPTKDRDDATRVDSFAEDLQELTGAEIWGHGNAAPATGNSRLVQVTDTNGDANAERYQVRDVLARKFLMHVGPTLTEPQMSYLEQTLKISEWIKDTLRYHGNGKKELDRFQVFVEEISMMGYDELFNLLIPTTAPDASTFRSLFPEHNQIDKLVDGAAAVHARFHDEVEKKKKAIAAAKTEPGFPGGVSP
jgi:hypothetical protein